MKNYSERTQDILSKATKEKRKRRRITATVSSLTCIALVICITLALLPPNNNRPGNLAQYSNTEYYPIITKLSAYQEANKSTNTFWDNLIGGIMIDGVVNAPGAALPEATPDYGTGSTNGTGSYQEITDLQVEGVGEADRIKRTSKYIYYLRGNSLHIYSIAGENSQEVGSYLIDDPYDTGNYTDQAEIYLSADGSTVTILSPIYSKKDSQKYTLALNLDVTDPTHIRESGRMYVAGNYLSSRFIDGDLYVINQYTPHNINFEQPDSFVPHFGTPEQKQCIPMVNIQSPDEITATNYTVVCRLDGKTLEMVDSSAYLSFSTEVYVSKDSIFLTRHYTDTVKSGEVTTRTVKTEISRLHYGGETLENKGSIVIDGRIENQYSMDQKEHILRVVTTIDSDTYQEHRNGETSSMTYLDDVLSASLYCIDLNTWETIAEVTAFAPQGEEVRSVRFDDDSAYVCTSVVLTDPVFFFNLSDLNNITWKDTGTIDGYSLSLVDFADGYTMGIGYGSSFNTLKIEIYQEGVSTVESYCKYEYPGVSFAQEYKAYYIDRENGLIGLAVLDYNLTGNATRYLLLHFDGYELNEVANIPINGRCDLIRGAYIEDYLYVLGDDFSVEKIG